MTEKHEKSTEVRPKALRSRCLGRIVSLGLLVLMIGAGYEVIHYQNGNFRIVVPNRIYRSGQAKMEQYKRWIEQYHIETVVNLRGDAGQQTRDERALFEDMNVTYCQMEGVSAYRIPDSNVLKALIEMLESVKPPVLIHCRHGVDRSGTVSALACMALEGRPYPVARREAFVMPGPWKRRGLDGQHISDLFTLYDHYCLVQGQEPKGWEHFKHWALDIYPSEKQSH